MKYLAVLLVLAAPAAAQDDFEVPFSPLPTAVCTIEHRKDRIGILGCPGTSARACVRDGGFGGNPRGLYACFDEELTYWRARLDVVQGQLRASADQLDALNDAPASGVPATAEALDRAIAAMPDPVKAFCESEALHWLGFADTLIALKACEMEMTAYLTLRLENRPGDLSFPYLDVPPFMEASE